MRRIALATLLLLGCSNANSSPTPSGPVVDYTSDAPVDPDAVVASWQGGQLTMGELLGKLDNELRMMQVEHLTKVHEAKSRALESLVIEHLLAAEVKRRGLADVGALLVEEVEKKVTAPSDQEVASFFPVVQRQLPPGTTLEAARPLIRQELIRRAQGARYNSYVEDLMKGAAVKQELPYPNMPRIDVAVADHDPILGNKDAPVTIVQFAEYECYFCNQVNPTLDRLLATYAAKLKLVFKDFPLSSHARAMPAAVAAHCAGEQGKYWEMNRKLLANQSALSDADFGRHIRDLGLDRGSFDSCMQSGRHADDIRADLNQGTELGVTATPTFFVNGMPLAGAQPFEQFAAAIDRALEGS